MGKEWRPRRGGDGGEVPQAESKRDGGRRTFNSEVYMTCGPREMTVETVDPGDRAHGVRDAHGLLVSARHPLAARRSRPRRYHPSSMTSRGVSYDTAFDDLHDAEQWLHRELGRPKARGPMTIRQFAAMAGSDEIRLRDITERHRKRLHEQDVESGDAAVEAASVAWIAAEESRRSRVAA